MIIVLDHNFELFAQNLRVLEISKSQPYNIESLNYEILKNPMGLIEFTLNHEEKVTAEAAAMVYIRGNIKTETRMRKGGFLKSLKAAAFGGEALVMEIVGPGTVYFQTKNVMEFVRALIPFLPKRR